MANAKNNFVKGTFRVGNETLQAFPLKQFLSNSFGKMGMTLPMDLSKTNESGQR